MENTHLDLAAQSGTACPQEQEQTILVDTTVTEKAPMTRAEILDRVKTIAEGPIEEVKDEIEALKQAYYRIKRAEVEAAYKLHIENGLPENEFTPQHDELEEPLKELLNAFKERKAQYLIQQEKQREENLARKQALLAELKGIVETPDEVGKQYQRVQQIQQEFKAITDVPAQAVTDLWKNYQNWTFL